MIFRTMKGTGLKISRFSLGTMMYGGQTNEADSIDMIHYAIDKGITSIDTADMYNTGAIN
jgi:aryl-alcohol dehydrogenase-like predicted oxidoreductase